MKKKPIALSGISIKSSKNLKNHIFLIKHCFFLLFLIRFAVMMKKLIEEEESIEILKSLALIKNVNE